MLECVENHRIEYAAALGLHHIHRESVWKRQLLAASVDQCVVYVGHCHDAAGKWNLVVGEAERITATVPTLVVSRCDLSGDNQEIDAFDFPRGAIDHVLAVFGMLFHQLDSAAVKGPGFRRI